MSRPVATGKPPLGHELVGRASPAERVERRARRNHSSSRKTTKEGMNPISEYFLSACVLPPLIL
jgi:hypothetical protein